jgi:hypothetical protein
MNIFISARKLLLEARELVAVVAGVTSAEKSINNASIHNTAKYSPT